MWSGGQQKPLFPKTKEETSVVGRRRMKLEQVTYCVSIWESPCSSSTRRNTLPVLDAARSAAEQRHRDDRASSGATASRDRKRSRRKVLVPRKGEKKWGGATCEVRSRRPIRTSQETANHESAFLEIHSPTSSSNSFEWIWDISGQRRHRSTANSTFSWAKHLWWQCCYYRSRRCCWLLLSFIIIIDKEHQHLEWFTYALSWPPHHFVLWTRSRHPVVS